jgi:hypothetical protein
MPFPTAAQVNIPNVQEGQAWGSEAAVDLSTISYQDGLNLGRFARIDANGILSNLDGSATPLLAGVTLVSPTDLLEKAGQAGSFGNGLFRSEPNQNYRRQGLVTVKLAAGAPTPTEFAPVYTINATTGTDNGNVTPATGGTNVATTAEFLFAVTANIWVIRIK